MRKLFAALCALSLFYGAAPAFAQSRINFDQGVQLKSLLKDAGIKPLKTKGTADWTVMVFLNAKNNLAPYGVTNFKQMEAVGSTSRVKIAVEFGLLGKTSVPDGWHGARRFLVEKSNDPSKIISPVLAEIPNVDMGDWHELVNFADWAKKNFPARHYMLVVWDHGDGWLQARRSPAFKALGISFDDETGDHISTTQLGEALAAIGGVDVYASDACLMQMAEVDYQIRNDARTIVGSEETEPDDGYTYDALLGPLAAKPDMNPEALGRLAVETYNAHYVGSGSNVTTSAVRVSGLQGLIPLLKGWTARIMADNDAALVKSARSGVQAFDIQDNVDLYDFARLISQGTKDSVLKSESRGIMDYLQNQLVIENGTVGYANAHGLAVYLPAGGMDPSYNQIAWANASGWENFARWVSNLESDANSKAEANALSLR